ncbi:MAG: hypothetical protein WC858_01220 [Parcubacteria group bacterium]
MKNIIRSLVFIIAVAAIAGVATYAAYHTDGTVAGVTASADPMYLRIDANPARDVFDWRDSFTVTTDQLHQLGLDKLRPGSSGEQIFDIKNVGDVPGSATIKFDKTAGSSVLADNLIVTVHYDDDNDNAGWEEVTHGPLSAWNHNTYQLGPINGNPANDDGNLVGSMASVKVAWSIPFSSVGNSIMGQSVTFNTTFGLDQIEE